MNSRLRTTAAAVLAVALMAGAHALAHADVSGSSHGRITRLPPITNIIEETARRRRQEQDEQSASGLDIRAHPRAPYSHFRRRIRPVDPRYNYGVYLSFPYGHFSVGGHDRTIYPYGYFSYDSGPRTYVRRTRREYIVLQTPAVGRRYVVRTAPDPGRTVEPEGVARRPLRFGSRLSPMLGAGQQVGPAFALGEAMLRQGRFAEAIAAFQQALGEDPLGHATRVGLALALTGDGQYQAAAYMLRRGLARTPDWDGVRPDLPELFGGPDAYEAVATRLAEAASDRPDDADTALLVGFCHFGTAQYVKAAEVLSPLHEADPSDEVVSGLLAAAERRIGSEPPSGATEREPEEKAAGSEAELP